MAFIQSNLPCPSCPSSDGYGIDDNGWGRCFVCETNVPPERVEETPMTATAAKATPLRTDVPVRYREFRDRKIDVNTAEKYGVGYRGDDIVFPYGENDEACKVRVGGAKQFRIEGDWNATKQLFGQSRFSSGGKYILVVEGEFDALAAHMMLGKKYAVVSVRNGAQSALKDCKNAYDYLDSFQEIIFCFDNDAPGIAAQAECAELFSHKAKVMKPTNGLKDAGEYLEDARTREFVDAFWRAERWTPDGIVAGSSLYDEVMKPLAKADAFYPFEGLNKMTYGLRKAEMTTVTAGSGLGKSQFLREIIWHLLQNTESNIGLMFLEESTRKTGLSLMSLAADKPLHLPDCDVSDKEKQDAFNATLGTDRIYMLDHFGSTDCDSIVNRVRYLAKVVGCDYVFVDHISIIVSAQANGDERKAIDEIMTKLRMMVQETGISLICVSHLKRPESKGHEEGAATSLAQLRGSGSIAQLSDMVIGLERNGQAEDKDTRNTTKVRVLKNRFSGVTGPACSLLYDHDTGRMSEVDDEDEVL